MDDASVHRIDDAQFKRLKATQIAFSSQYYITAPTHGCWDHPGLQVILQAEPPLPHRTQGENRHHVQSPERRYHPLGHRVGLPCLVQSEPLGPSPSASQSAASKVRMTPERRLSRLICPCLNSQTVILRN